MGLLMLLWLISAWARIPLRVLHCLGAAAGVLVYLGSRDYRNKFDRQAQAANLSKSQRWAAIAHSGRWAAETPWIWLRPMKAVAQMVHCTEWKTADDAFARGKGVILLTPHLGCYEAAGRAFACRRPLTVLYKPPKQVWLADLLERHRGSGELATAAATRSGVMQLMRVLKSGGTIGILPDQVPGLDQGVWVKFFGEPAYTMSLPGRLAEVSGAAVLIGVCERLPKAAGWQLHFRTMQEPFDAQSINDAMEHLIREFPEQYIWGYNRFRQPRAEAAK